MQSRKLIASSPLGPKAPRLVYQAFDDAWSEIISAYRAEQTALTQISCARSYFGRRSPAQSGRRAFREASDESTAEPGVGASRVDTLAVIGDRQMKLPRGPLQHHLDGAFCVARKSILEEIL
jgi:hypothetical protein